jgi:hypothetical protein
LFPSCLCSESPAHRHVTVSQAELVPLGLEKELQLFVFPVYVPGHWMLAVWHVKDGVLRFWDSVSTSLSRAQDHCEVCSAC